MANQKIAPAELIRQDFKSLKTNEKLDTTSEIEELIFMQSMEGRSHNGAGLFHKRYFVNTTIDDVVIALGRNPTTVKSKRQELIDEIFQYAKAAIKGKAPRQLLNNSGQPFLGIAEFKKRTVNPDDILRGLYLGGLRDDAQIRKIAEEKYKTHIGCGTCYLVNTQIMDKLGLDGEKLAHEAYEEDIERFKQVGLIVEPKKVSQGQEKHIRYLYIRHRVGPGQSDDAAFVAAGLLYNTDVAIGVFLSDAVDTLEKYVLNFRDQDDEIAFYIRDNYPKLDITLDEVYELTYLAAIPEGKEEEVPDSSLRYFLTIDSNTGQSGFITHLNFIEGKPYYPTAISYKRILVTEFYDYIKEKVMAAGKPIALISPRDIIKGLDRNISEVMRTSVLTLGPEVSLKDALTKLHKTGSEIIIIQDKEKRVLGVVRPSDFLYLLRTKSEKGKT